MKKLLLTSLILTWTLSLGTWNFAEGAHAAFTNHILGDKNAPIHMEIYDDFECPFCQRLHNTIQDPSIQKLIDNGSLKITIKDFPLSFHANGENSSKAANAVGHLAPEKYYEMVDLIFANQYSWGSDAKNTFANYAEKLGVNRSAFLEAYSDPRNLQEIQVDLSEGSRRGVSGTPASFINGTLLSGAQPLSAFLTAIEEANQGNPAPAAGFEDKVITNPIANPFSDTNLSTAAGTAAKELHRLAIIGGFPDGSFREGQAVNRAEAAKFLLLASGKGPNSEAYENNFLDVISSEWYGPFVLKAAFLKIIEGFSDKSFRPGAKIQRDQFLAMLARTFKLPSRLAHSFTDKNENPSAWYWDYAGIASKYDLFPGETRLNPGNTMTRGEVAVAIHQYLKNK
jgi:predicted DsbA family dithiol-disulfide isomerase